MGAGRNAAAIIARWGVISRAISAQAYWVEHRSRTHTRGLKRPIPATVFAILKRPLRSAWKTVLCLCGRLCGSGEIGRHTILRGWRPKGMGVQVPPSAPWFTPVLAAYREYEITSRAWFCAAVG